MIRKKIMHWMWNGRPEWTWKVDDRMKHDPDVIVGRMTCAIWGHEPIMDHCGNPEHDYCVWCKRSMPGKAPRKPKLA